MSKLNVVRRCFNCGAVLQDTDVNAIGYVDKELFESNNTVLLCKSCWEQQTFNNAPKEAHVNPDYITMLKDARASDAMIVYVVDLFSFESSFVHEITDIIRNLNILVIANKRDLLPADYPDEKIKEYVAHRFRVATLPVQAKDVELTSLTSLTDISAIVNRVLDQRKRHDVYLVGALYSGKTLFLSSFLRSYSNDTRRPVSTSCYQDTNMKVLQIPLDSSSTIFDSPGISIDNSLVSKVDGETAKSIIPDEPVKGRNIAIEENDSLFFGGLARIDLLKGAKQNIIAYVSNNVQVSKVNKNVEETFINALKSKTLVPSTRGIESLSDFDAFDIIVDEKGNRDIGIEGLGWISFVGNNQTFRIFVPKGVGIYTTRAKLDYVIQQ